MSISEIDELWPTRKQCEFFDVCDRTLSRWEKNPKLEFPSFIEINGRKYRSKSAIQNWAHSRIASIAGA
jgi:hypothetical protein